MTESGFNTVLQVKAAVTNRLIQGDHERIAVTDADPRSVGNKTMHFPSGPSPPHREQKMPSQLGKLYSESISKPKSEHFVVDE